MTNEPKERMNLHKQEGRSLLISYFSVIMYVNHLNDQCTLYLGHTIIQLQVKQNLIVALCN